MSVTLKRRSFIKYGLLGAVGTLIASYPLFIERYHFQVNTYQIPVPNLPRVFKDFKIVQMTDLHFGFLMPLFIVEHLIQKINALEKDIVVCTGDYVHEFDSNSQIDTLWPQLMKLRARKGVYSVLGNHDHWASFNRSLYWLERSGQNVRHRAISISDKGERIWIGGAGDFMEDDLSIDKAFENVPSNECKILLAHNPDSADSYFTTKVDLMISGHTHGGQVNIPFIGTPVLAVHNKKYSSGFIRSAKTNLYISRGLGWSMLPVRFNCPPEISILNLVPSVG
ncbi:MAG: metallophosphoesterase [Candidatus Scalindua sp. AMX11]|nr:MAG: metallophosphoesterase [Candidatus Scalindua sp.]NOG84242.1 metallophosphoesterase [Planctomycetota bacterium]RZV61463.1 MAG: metallophosphoesterase [Candidatus Scalindua sp. SCAELEC01]TDE63214.1 MAG: metallophosphoesterase [Candidatus Scalindua sp. AMX11]GJQ57545.1 MAG: phosphohydrolase [Candidatus Scalindua sp.]